MEKVVVACDSFKGSLSSCKVGNAVETAVKSVYPHCEVVKMVIGDGGEGTMEAIANILPVTYETCRVHDPLMNLVEAKYAVLYSDPNVTTCFLELAQSTGITLVPREKLNPSLTSTVGLGEMLDDAIGKGYKKIYVALGSSCVNDGGVGMLTMLGYRFLDKEGAEIDFSMGGGGCFLSDITKVCRDRDVLRESGVSIITLHDTLNVITGPTGATRAGCKAKGGSAEMEEELEKGMLNLVEVVKNDLNVDLNSIPGSGTSGGVGGAFAGVLGSEVRNGIETVLELVGFEDVVRDADLVITGEGCLDFQTWMGKAPLGVLCAATRVGVPVVAIAGCVEFADIDADTTHAHTYIPSESESKNVVVMGKQGPEFLAVFPVLHACVPLEKAMEEQVTMANIHRTVRQMMRMAGLSLSQKKTRTGSIKMGVQME